MNVTRNYGIDFLRLVLMFMVCMLHVLGQGGVLVACVEDSISYRVFWLIEVFSYCAVDAFAFISGYTAINKPQNYSKLTNLWFQAVFYSFVVSVLLTCIGLEGDWNTANMIKRLLPVTFNQFWYFTAYFVLFFSVPILNEFLFKVEKYVAKKTCIVLFALFSMLGFLADPFQSQWGYSAIWIVVLYCLGVLAKRIQLFEQRRLGELIFLWGIMNLSSWSAYVFFDIQLLVNYLSPTILMSAVLLVVIFSRLNFNGTVIRRLSPLAFGIYLLQLNPIVWNEVIKSNFSFIAKEPIALGMLYVFLVSSIIFIIGIIVEAVRAWATKTMRIEKLSCKIVSIVDLMIERASIILG